MSCLIQEFSLSITQIWNPPKDTPIDLRIVNLLITCLAPVASLYAVLAAGHSARFSLNFWGNYVMRSLNVDFLLIKSVFPDLNLLSIEDQADLLLTLLSSDLQLAESLIQLLEVLKVATIISLIFGALVAYRHKMHPEFYNQNQIK